MRKPLNLNQWIKDNQEFLKPPVGNKKIWKDADTTVMVVGGPNARSDFHVNPTEELFYQIQGDLVLKIVEDKRIKDIKISQGEIFLLPALTPHSPQRIQETIGLVIEVERHGKEDKLQWYCPHCVHLLYEESFELTDIENQFQAVFSRYEQKNLKDCPYCHESI